MVEHGHIKILPWVSINVIYKAKNGEEQRA